MNRPLYLTNLLLIALGVALSQTASSADLVVQLTTVMHNGYNISCFGGQDGSFHVEVSGGTPPYDIYINDAAVTSADVNLQPAGYYHVTVYDTPHHNDPMNFGEAQISLTEPQPLQLSGTMHVYGNNFNESCYHCFDGYITLNGQGGVEPYSYLWFDYNINQTHYSLGAGSYSAIMTDANGCVINSENFYVSSPSRDDWTLLGNSGIDSTKFMGTTDNKDFIFKTNNTERLRIKRSGKLVVSSLLEGTGGMVYVNSDGELESSLTQNPPPNDNECTFGTAHIMFRSYISPHATLWTCPYINIGIGTYSPAQLFTVNGNSRLISNSSTNSLEILGNGAIPANRGISLDGNPSGKFNFYINGSQSNASFNFINKQDSSNLMTINSKGQVGIGLITAVTSSSKLQVEGTIAAREVKVTSMTPFPDFVFESTYRLRSLNELEKYIAENKHLPEIFSAKEVSISGGIDLGAMQLKLLQKIEELTLYLIKQDKKITELEMKIVK